MSFVRNAKLRGKGWEKWWEYEDLTIIQFEDQTNIGEESTQGLDATHRPLSVNGRLRKFTVTAEHAETEE